MSDSLDELTELGTTVLGRAHEHHESLTSSNDRAAVWARSGGPHGALITADAQTGGRGRRGRPWHSPPGENLYASLVLRPPAGAALDGLSLAIGLGLRDGLAAWSDGVRLKWPNDLVLGERKLGGILCEAHWQGDRVEVIAGFGINIHTQVFPGELAMRAISLAQVCTPARGPGRATVLAAVLGALEPTLARFFAHGFAGLREPYLAACATVGRTVSLAQGRALLVETLDDRGGLLGRDPETGEQVRIRSLDALDG